VTHREQMLEGEDPLAVLGLVLPTR
jgi:hypothetical protein